MQSAGKDWKKKTWLQYSNHFICSMLLLPVLFFLIIEQTVLMVLVFYEKCMLEKVTMQRTPQFADFSLSWKEPTPRQNECAGLSHARIVSTREGLVPIKFAIETTARQNGGTLNSLCLFSFCDDKDNTSLIRFKF